MRCIWSKWLGWRRDAWWSVGWEWVLARLADEMITEIKINSPLHECWGIISITPIKVNDVVLNGIYWERGRQQLWHLAFGGEMVNKMWRLVAFIGWRADDGESGCDAEGSIRLQGMLRRDCKSFLLHNNVAHAKLFFIQPQACRQMQVKASVSCSLVKGDWIKTIIPIQSEQLRLMKGEQQPT